MKKTYTWEDVTIPQAQQILQVVRSDDQDMFKLISILAIMDDVEEEVYDRMKIPEVRKEVERIMPLLEKAEPRFRDGEYVLNGTTYVLTPSVPNMTSGQYIDYVSTLRDRPDDWVELLSILLVPKGMQYGQRYDLDRVRKDIEERFLWIDTLGVCFFFREVLRVSQTVTENYSKKKTLQQLRRQEKILKREMKREPDPERKKVIAESIERIREVSRSVGPGKL